MKLYTVGGFIIGGLLLAGVVDASAQNWGRPQPPPAGACFYEDINFGGQYFCAPIGTRAEQVPEAANDQISSIRLFGNAEVTVFRDVDFDGGSDRFDSDMRDLRRADWNDRISSFRIGRSDRGGALGSGSQSWWGRPRVPQSGACFYEDVNFGGRYFCAGLGDTTALVPSGTNDEISSIRIFGNARVEVFRDVRFDGDSRAFELDVNDLRRSGWNDRISSFRVAPRARGGTWNGQPNGGQSGGGRPTYQQSQEIVRRAYLAVLEREPDPGSNGWVNRVMSGELNEQQLMAELTRSDEYRARQRRR